MTRPCFALTLLFASLATTTLAVSTARCQIIVTLWDGDAVAESEDDAATDRDNTPLVVRDEADDENYDNAAGYFDDYLYEDYLFEGIGDDAPAADEEEDAAVRAASQTSSAEQGAAEKAADENDAADSAAIADDEPSLDPEVEYADDYCCEDYDCFGDDCYGDYAYDDEYGFHYSCPLAESAGAATADTADDSEVTADNDASADNAYDYHAGYDPVYDDVMFGDGDTAEAATAESASHQPTPEKLAADETASDAADSPQAWDDYNYDSGYDYESEYYDWYAEGDDASSDEDRDDLSDADDYGYDYDDYGYDDDYSYDDYGYDEAEFEQAYSEYWNGGETPASDASSSEDDDDHHFAAEASRVRESDEFAAEVQQAAAHSGAACIDLGQRVRNNFLLLVASTLDRVGGSLQDASDGLTRIAEADAAAEKR